ncbi:Chaperone protein htpG family protein isoform 2 [Hibiscus syriacus]|uniref:Chaperone protein htpG family protein isoform 2 n=1 Tax=Hibiscus syriacus TaxID=106335 RepID=A0A6A2XS29_HIBSY|nr:Chaperone protein htpG family protein isoform 2 [Hibiscus syriacus]
MDSDLISDIDFDLILDLDSDLILDLDFDMILDLIYVLIFDISVYGWTYFTWGGLLDLMVGVWFWGTYTIWTCWMGVVVSTKSPKSEKQYVWEAVADSSSYVIREDTNPEKLLARDEYNEFYKKTFNEFLDPLGYTHFTTEGEVEFRSVLYIPGMGPLNNEDVFPRYLSFVKGVVDSDDLPLNVSLEILQESRIVRIMRKRLVRKTFDMIQEISESENKEDYKMFWENFGRFLKLGCIEDTGNHKRITPLLRFYTSKNEEEMTSLDEHVENMGENQKAIYYLATDSLKSAKTAPFLEKLVQKDIEVLYLVEPIDEVAIQNLQTYKEKKFVDISKEDLELGGEDEVNERETKQEYNLLCDWIKQQLGDKVAKVQISKRLSSSPCVLVSGKLMKAQALGDTASLEFTRGRILEINPDHPIIKDLNVACKNAPESSDAKRADDLLYDTSLISSGFSPDSPAELGSKIYEMMATALRGRWGRSEDEDEDEVEASEVSAAETDTSVGEEGSENKVIEPSEVRTKSDPWQD